MLRVAGLVVRFGSTAAVDVEELEVSDSEIVTVLGPSGSGKSTLLRAIAGLQPADEGAMSLDGADLEALAPHERGIGLMFQTHALLPHRSVASNVGFGLRMKNMPAGQRLTRVAELLDLVGLSGYGHRAIATLSGGEAQRVALARSLAPEPSVLLLDEPFGSLDRALRDRLTDEVRAILKSAGTAALHVTHDHGEAFAVGDRVALMDAGRIVQIGTPEQVWEQPGSPAIARFLGHANIVDIHGETHLIRADAASLCAEAASGPRTAADVAACGSQAAARYPSTIAVPGPDDAADSREPADAGAAGSTAIPVRVAAGVVSCRYLGGRYLVRLDTEEYGRLSLELDRDPGVGELITIRLDPSRVISLKK